MPDRTPAHHPAVVSSAVSGSIAAGSPARASATRSRQPAAPGRCAKPWTASRSWGICGLIGGAPAGTEVRLDLNHILVGRSVRGILAGDSISDLFIPHMIELYLAGRFRFDRLITFYPLREINQAASDSHYSRVVKPVLRSWQYSGHPQIHRTRRAPIIAASEPQAPEDARLGQEPGPPI